MKMELEINHSYKLSHLSGYPSSSATELQVA